MKYLPFVFCSLSILSSSSADPPSPSGESNLPALSLSAVTSAVLAENPAIKDAHAKWQAMRKRVPQAAAWDDLKVAATSRVARFVDVANNSFTDQMLSVEQMIPVSGKNQSRARIAAAEAVEAFEAVRRRELDAIAKARADYYRLANSYALLELLRTNENSLQQTVDITRAKFEAAQRGQADVLIAENEVTKNQEARRDLELRISDETSALAVLMNKDPFAPLGKPASADLIHAHDLPGNDRLRALIVANRPEIRMAEAGIAAAKAKLELAKREWIPDPAITVEAQRYNGASQGFSEVAAGVTFNVPWFNGAKYHAEENEAEHGLAAAKYAADGARVEALGLLRDQLNKIETAHHHTELYSEKLIPTARATLEANRANYESGKATFLDLIQSERALFELQSMLREHVAAREAALAELEALVGTDLHLFSEPQPTAKRSAK